MPKAKMTFPIGSTVALRSGGPGLTVLGQVGDRVHCVFFSDELGDFKEAMLPSVALIIAEFEDEDGEEDESHEEGDEDGDEDNKK
jgi:uncharacterized protein YodC (DUF2158 family)